MKRIPKTLTFALILSTIISGCEKDKIQDIKFDKDLVIELNNKSTSKIVIDAHSYFLDVALWRDFMPFSPPDGKPLISLNWLISSDSSAIPSNIKLIQQYVIKGDSIWIPEYLNDKRYFPDYQIEKISINGPKWGPDIYVDVIAKITDTIAHRDYFLKRSNAYILRTW
jgi:hypothetical protein